MLVSQRIGICAAVATLATSACSGKDAMHAFASKIEHAPDVAAMPAPPSIDLRKVAKEPAAPPAPPWSPKDPQWSYVLGVDFGIRADEGGRGSFLAPRAHGKHNGVDFLAPVGTPVVAACNGVAKSDHRGGYGNVVQLVCKLPAELGGDEGLHASFFYAHLSKMNVGESYTRVKAGAKLGAVGKTGNASGPKIKPHLHLEVIVRESEEAAMEERHSGLVAKAKEASDRFFELLDENCLEPARFRPRSAEVRRERRTDPFVLLMCSAKPKPDLVAPDSADLREAQIKWSEQYAAAGFDVDRGPRKDAAD